VGQQLQWLEKNETLGMDIARFFKQNNNSVVAKAFGKLAIEAWIAGGDVDFQNKIIKDSTFVGTKADCVYELLSSTNNNLFKNVLSTFTNGKAQFELKFRIGEVPDGADGSTTFDNNTGIITITFPQIINAKSSIEIASIILHEGIHGELRRIYEGKNQVSEPLPNNQYEYLVDLWDYFRGISPPSKVSNNASHTYMVHNHVLPIANAVREFDNNTYGIDYYMWFGWQGLSDIGKITYPQLLTSSQETNYINLQQIPINDSIKQSCDE
tara:strand:- start:1017 stop:1820 length:804 start_codon:yes stop_codon:yes gene_type:complete